MTELVPADRIEVIVGMPRQSTTHLGRAVSAEERFYIVHSAKCRDTDVNLLDCPFSRALDSYGIDPDEFTQDTPVALAVDDDGYLMEVPLSTIEPATQTLCSTCGTTDSRYCSDAYHMPAVTS